VNGWEVDKAKADRYLPEIKSILGRTFIGAAPVEEDQERNTDLIVLKLEPIRIACRIRTCEYFRRYPAEFTIREGRPSGVKTELTKILEGWGQYFFYGFSDENQEGLKAWAIGDLNVFRLWFHRQTVRSNGILPGKQKNNCDGSSCFRAFSWDDLGTEFVVTKNNPHIGPKSVLNAAEEEECQPTFQLSDF